jgi:hypothetical protein
VNFLVVVFFPNQFSCGGFADAVAHREGEAIFGRVLFERVFCGATVGAGCGSLPEAVAHRGEATECSFHGIISRHRSSSMRKVSLFFVLPCFLAALVTLIYKTAIAQTETTMPPAENAPAQTPNASSPDVYAGVWQEGKAVFSDVELLDIFTKYARGYKPEQPIKFSHKIHVGKNKMECQYCHSGVSKSSFATIPSVESCMGCHNVVKTDSPEIQKLKGYFERKEAIPWVPVNNMPEHAHFNHERHVKAGVGCQSCHGQVQEMEVVEKVSSLKMGWCLTCHRERGASIDCAVCHY